MNDLKCKICGGTLEPLSGGDLKCDSCGAVVSKAALEKKRQDGRFESAGAAKELLESGAFGSAYLIYENLLTQDPKDAEARWGLVLCRYGVLYQLDELTGEMLPTVNRMRYDSILQDPDYLATLEYAPESKRDFYIWSAHRIADIQKRYLAIAEAEAPYDVFISFKAENADGTRSRDSVIGQEIYNQLTEHGLRVFYSRITLEDKGGEEFEPYIFSALHTAKVLLLIGTRKEHILAPWVVNEWQRYLISMQEMPDKNLLPVYEGLELSEFPEEIPTREAIDYSKQGALLELTQGVLSITGKGVLVEAQDTRASLAKLTNGLRQAVESGDFSHARELANAVLDLDAENSDAYYYLLLAYYEVRKATALSDIDEPWPENRNYLRALKYADPARKQLLEALRQRREMRLEEERKNRLQKAEEDRREQELLKAIREGKEKIRKMEYAEAFRILSQKATGSPEGDHLITVSKKGMEVQELLSDNDWLDHAIKRDHPEDYFKMQRLKLRAEKVGSTLPRYYVGVIAAGFVFFCLACVVLTTIINPEETLLGSLWTLAGTVIAAALMIIGVIMIPAGLVKLIHSLYGQHIRKAYDTHMQSVIEPLRKLELDRLSQEYEPWLGEALKKMLQGSI